MMGKVTHLDELDREPVSDFTFDIVIVGASFGNVAAALAAARYGAPFLPIARYLGVLELLLRRFAPPLPPPPPRALRSRLSITAPLASS
jgi:hypothetical protein